MLHRRIFALNENRGKRDPIQVLLLLFIFTVFSLALNQISASFFDTAYQIKTGELAITEFSLPKDDPFSFAYPKNEWIPHYWLSGVIFYVEYIFFGYIGLIVGSAIMAALTYWIILKTIYFKTGDYLLGSALIILTAFLTFELWVPRPQIFSYFFTALLILILEKWRADRSSKFLYWLPLLFLFWANMHAGVIFGLLLFGLYGIASLIKDRGRIGWKIIPAGIVSFFASLINPSGYKTLLYGEIIKPAIKEVNVLEWRPFLDFIYKFEAKIFLLEMIIVSGLLIWWSVRERNEEGKLMPNLLQIGIGIVAIALPLMSIRHVGFFPILTASFLSVGIFAQIKKRKIDLGYLKTPLIACFLIISAITLIHFVGKSKLVRSIVPVDAIRFIKETELQGPIFSGPFESGSLTLELYPKEKIFIDGRSEVFAGEINQEYLSIMNQSPGWEKIFDEKYKFNAVVAHYLDQNANFTAALFNILALDDKFKLVYWDDAVIILLRNIPENKQIIDKHAYKLISPFIDLYSFPIEKRKEVGEEILRAVNTSPDNSKIFRALIR